MGGATSCDAREEYGHSSLLSQPRQFTESLSGSFVDSRASTSPCGSHSSFRLCQLEPDGGDARLCGSPGGCTAASASGAPAEAVSALPSGGDAASCSAMSQGLTDEASFGGTLRFTVAIERRRRRGAGEQRFGFRHTVIPSCEALVILEVEREGALDLWNQRCVAEGLSEQYVCPGDALVAVEGTKNLEVMRMLLRESVAVSFTVERWPRIFSVELDRKVLDASFGLDVGVEHLKDGTRRLLVFKILNGVLQDWNSAALLRDRRFMIVPPGSEILRVIAGTGDCCEVDEMQSLLRAACKVELVIRRPALGPSSQ